MREFRVSFDHADLKRCEAAEVDPEELVKTSVREALNALPDPAEDEGVSEEVAEPEAVDLPAIDLLDDEAAKATNDEETDTDAPADETTTDTEDEEDDE